MKNEQLAQAKQAWIDATIEDMRPESVFVRGYLAAHEAVAAVPVEPMEPVEYKPGNWYKTKGTDDMRRFFRSRLPAIRNAARDCGYAIGVHGSERRDFDLMAMPWREDAAEPDMLAHAVANAACGISLAGAYQWTTKPAGRVAVSIPICWTTDHRPSAGHIDLSVLVVAPQPQQAAAKEQKS